MPRWKKKFKKNTSGGRENESKPNYIEEISSKGCCPPRKILGNIIKVDQRRTSINGSENKKTHDNAFGIIPEKM